jgi:hypothetical protein
MSTEKQNEANRANAQLSTGPRTEEGKAKSSLNAMKHGLTATHLLIPTESADDFEAHAASLRAHFAPADPLRSLLVDQLIAAAWRLRRARLFERLILEQRADDIKENLDDDGTTYNDPADYFALAYRGDCSGEKALDTLSRHETRIERAFYRALKALGDPPRIGFVLQNSPVGPDRVGRAPSPARDPLVPPSDVGRTSGSAWDPLVPPASVSCLLTPDSFPLRHVRNRAFAHPGRAGNRCDGSAQAQLRENLDRGAKDRIAFVFTPRPWYSCLAQMSVPSSMENASTFGFGRRKPDVRLFL